MKLEQGVRALAERIRSGVAGGDPYLLVLGAGVSRAAKVPPLSELSTQTTQPIVPGDRRLIDRLLSNVPVPSFYQDIANIAREGLLPRVVTTSYDSLLERTLEDAGLRAPYNYATVDVGGTETAPPQQRDTDPPLRIVHVYGSLPGGALAEALRMPRPSDPLGVVMVGFEFESSTLTDFLEASTPGDLWWVAPGVDARPPDRLRWGGQLSPILGEAAELDRFFGQLGLILLGLPSDTSPGDDDDPALEEQLYRSKLAQARTYKQSIEQRIASVGSDPAAARQLDYQASQISELEQRLAKSGAAGQLDRMRAFAAQLDAAAATGAVDAETVAFFHSQLDVLERELTRPEPNRNIVAGAQAALAGLAAELGPRLGGGQSSA